MFKRGFIIIVLLAVVFILWSLGKSLRTENGMEDNGPPSPGTPTSADNAPPGSIHNLPVPDAVAAVRSKIAEELEIGEGLVIIMTAYEKEWPDACLGLVGEGEFCAQVITPGYEVTAQAQGKEFKYRTDSDGDILREEK